MRDEIKLSKQQISELAKLVIEVAEQPINIEQVSDICLAIFDDIAGLELLTASEQQELIHDIWSDIQKN